MHMKIIQLFATLAGFSLLTTACEEKPITIPALELGDRKVLVEELTGVQCQNCPDGTAELIAAQKNLGDRLIIVTLHAAKSFDEPYPENKQDFRSDDCRAIADYLYYNGDPGAPTAAVDRQFADDFTGAFIYRPWTGAINTRVGDKPDIGLFINQTYNEEARRLDVEINVSPDEALSGDIRLSVYITEDSIQDVQLKRISSTQVQKVLDYTHRHIFRDALSVPTGDPISAELGEGKAFTKKYSVVLPTAPNNWNPKQCSVVAFIHRHGEHQVREVLQAEEKHILD